MVIPVLTLALLGNGFAQAGEYEAGVEALKANDLSKAARLLESAVAAQPDHAEAWWELGWVHWRAHRLPEARDAWRKVFELAPEKPELVHWLTAVETKLALKETGAGAADVALEPAGAQIRIVAAGDTMMGSDLRRGARGLAPGNGEALFAHVKDLFAAADVAFLNLEGTLADDLPQTKCRPDSVSCYAFRTPCRYANALKTAGIDVVSNANNHAMDLGVAGMSSTLGCLNQVNIAHASRYGDTALLEGVKGLAVAVVAAHSGSCCPNVNDVAEVTAAIRLADREADLVILSMHAGAEGARARHVPGKTEIAYGERRGDVKKLARAAVDAGADLVLGHGPHVLRAMEVYRGRLIAYSLGNFMGYKQFGLRGGLGGTTVMLDVTLAANGVLVAGKLHPVALDRQSVPHPDPKKLGLKHVRELTRADFPISGVRVGKDGTLGWSAEKKP
jgi:hypothetical protein